MIPVQSLVPSTPIAALLGALLPDAAALQFDQLIIAADQLTCVLSATQLQAACPLCGQNAQRVHSHYRRTLADLAWATIPVQLQLSVRRFFCPNQDCPRKLFTERLNDLTLPYARRTNRLREQIRDVGFALGGEAGARSCARQGISVSPDTLLSLLRRQSPPASSTPRVLGVDDWSFRRAQPLATILVDLERHQVIDLLQDSTAETFAAWLRAHPGVEIISRDRGEAYATGGRSGAPEAIHIADRWHLMKNLGDSVQKLMTRQAAARQQAAQALAPCPAQTVTVAASLITPLPIRRARKRTLAAPSPRRAWQQQMYAQVQARAAQGVSVNAIARELKLSRATVRKYRDREPFEDQWTSGRRSAVEPYRAYLEHRWAEGCTEVKQLWQEIQSQGYAGSYKSVWLFVRNWHVPEALAAPTPPPSATPPTRTPRQAMWLLMREPDALDAEEEAYREALCQKSVQVGAAYPLVQDFAKMVRNRLVDRLDAWLKQAEESGVRELRGFVQGLRQDYAAVRAALEYEWSQGPVESQVNRLKQLKRQMYGRANFDLLRLRVLHSGP